MRLLLTGGPAAAIQRFYWDYDGLTVGHYQCNQRKAISSKRRRLARSLTAVILDPRKTQIDSTSV